MISMIFLKEGIMMNYDDMELAAQLTPTSWQYCESKENEN
jgi:hypothetical protein